MTKDDPGRLAELRRGSGVKLGYDLLRDEILDLKLAPGSAIDEVQLAARFGMSRTPIREALVRLAGEGLIETLPNRSTMVANIDFLNMPAYFDALVLMYRVTTRLAAQHHTADDLVVIRQRQEEFSLAVRAQDALAMIATNAAFHSAIAAAGRNTYYAGFFERLLSDGRRMLRLYYQSYNDRLPSRFMEEHEEIIAAVEARDIAAADRLGKAHGEQIVEQIGRLLLQQDRHDIEL